MTYWKLGCNWGKGKPNFYDLLKKKSIVICAEHDMQIGDIVAVTSGYTVIALAEIIADKCSVTTVPELESDFSSYEIDYEDWNYIAKCKLYELDASNRFQYPLQQGICQIQKKEIIKSIEIFFMEKQAEQLREDCVRILKNNHNLILTGAPGTGKTYLAKEIAKAMGCSENEIGFVQFHPSYDYTDFVEGLRPKDDSGNIGFEHRDGVFKEFCTRALKNNTVTNNFDDVFDTFLNDIRDNENFLELNTPSGSKFYVSVNQRRSLTFYTGQENKVGGSLTRKGVKTEYEGKPFYKYWLGYYNGVINYMKAKYNLHSVTEDKKKNFVFIIDEINRGEISKIFGELFFTIDPGYRGEDGKVRTQYANMQTEPNDFDDALGINDPDNCGHFFIPENVYIIGTMNDIDRSVESMDFAFRRRFAFKEVTAEESQGMLDSVEAWGQDENGNSLKPADDIVADIKKKMDNLNKAIWHKPIDGESDEDKSIEGLSSAYHIGASYFLKLNNYKNDDGSFDFDKLWEYHLEGLLFEYLRGMTELSKKLKKLAEAYGYTKASSYE